MVRVSARVHRAWFVGVMTMGLLAGACGSGTSILHSAAPVARPTNAPNTGSVNGVAVIRAWSDALRRGDVRAAARYFALPSVMVNGSDGAGRTLVIAIGSRAQAEEANAALPCGARLLSAEPRGRYVNALFRLTGRPGLGGTDCGSGAGRTARTNFVIAHGLIVQWIRAPDDPGDNGSPATPTPGTPTSPSPQSAAPTI
jgi:hypothetical protein